MVSVTSTDRESCLRRDKYKCVICGRPLIGCVTGYSIHHRHMRSHNWDGINSPSNLISVCGSGTTGCHGRIHANPEDAYNHGWLLHAWEEQPAEVPLSTYFGDGVRLDDDWRVIKSNPFVQ